MFGRTSFTCLGKEHTVKTISTSYLFSLVFLLLSSIEDLDPQDLNIIFFRYNSIMKITNPEIRISPAVKLFIRMHASYLGDKAHT